MLNIASIELKQNGFYETNFFHTDLDRNLLEAVKEWQAAFGTERATYKTSEYAKNTLDEHRKIPAVVSLINTSEIVKALRIARKYDIKVYPISTGNNWGYGSAMPVEDYCVIFDLKNMKRILNFDRELGTVTVEPGVSQQDLYEYLQKNGPEFLVPVTGAGPSCSILGNALERGYGITPHTDHFAAVNSLKAVLPNGDIYCSHFSSLNAEEIDKLHKWGLGPYMDGLFTQSNLGIVTEITIDLKKKSEAIELFTFRVKTDIQLEQTVKIIHEILNEVGENLSGINLMNNSRIISMTANFPFEQLNFDNSNHDEVFDKIARKYHITPWTGIGAIYGTKAVVKAVKKTITKKLSKIDRFPIFMDRKKVNLFKTIQKFVPFTRTDFLNNIIEKVESTLNILEGIPQKVAIPLAYWKNTQNPYLGHGTNHNPAKDNCGLIWFTPLIPLKQEAIRQYTDIVKNVCTKNKIEPLITMTTLSEKVVDSSVPIVFDRSNPEDCKNAKNCYLELYEECGKLGYLPYRMGVNNMHLATENDSVYWNLVQKIKETLDPQNILSPSRYCPTQKEQY